MTDDLVARLRAQVANPENDIVWGLADAADEIERLRGEVRNWRELHRVVAEELGANIESWPDHRNAPLAIAATFMLHKQHAEKAEAELADVKVKWMGQIGQCATLSTQIDRLEAERDALLQTLREIADADNMSIDGACAHARHTLRTVGKMGA